MASWTLGLVLPALAIGLMLLGGAMLPLQDFSEHLHMAAVLVHGGGADYTSSSWPHTYTGIFWLWRGLATVLPLELGGRVIVLLYVLGCVGGCALLLRRLRPEMPRLAALALGWWLPFSFFYYMGFLPYLAALPVLLLLAAEAHALRTTRSTARRVAAVAAALVVLYLLHPMGIALALAVIVALLALVEGRPESAGWRVWAPLLTVNAALLALALAPNLDTVTGGLAGAGGRAHPFGVSTWSATLGLLARLPLGPLQGGARVVQWVALGLLGIALVVGLVGRPPRRPGFGWLLALALAILVGAVLLAARQSSGTIYHRLFIYPYIFALLAWASRARWRRPTTALVVAAAALHLVATGWAHRAFAIEAAPARALLARVPAEAEVLPLLFDRDSAAVQDPYVHVFQHVGAYHPATFAGRYPYSPDHAPLPVRPRFSAAGYPPLSEPWRFAWNDVLRRVPYLLLRTPGDGVLRVPVMAQAFGRVLLQLEAERGLLQQQGRWSLWGLTARASAQRRFAWPPAAAADPRVAEGRRWFEQGVAWMRQKRYARAVDAFERSLRAQPDHPAALTNLGICLDQQGEHRRAVEILERVVARRPDEHGARFGLAQAHQHLGNRAQAIRRFREYLARAPESRWTALARQRLAELGAPP